MTDCSLVHLAMMHSFLAINTCIHACTVLMAETVTFVLTFTSSNNRLLTYSYVFRLACAFSMQRDQTIKRELSGTQATTHPHTGIATSEKIDTHTRCHTYTHTNTYTRHTHTHVVIHTPLSVELVGVSVLFV
jgi:hypothetical protein